MREGEKLIEGLPPEARRALPTAKDWLDSSPFVLDPRGDLLEAIAELGKRELAAAPVVAHDGRLLGMLTEKDCLRVLSVGSFHTPRSGHVGDFMSTVPVAVGPEHDPFEMAEIFLRGNFPVLPVCDKAGRLLGTVSRHRMLRGILELVERFEKARKPSPDIAKVVTDGPRGIERMQQLFANFSPEQMARVLGRRRD